MVIGAGVAALLSGTVAAPLRLAASLIQGIGALSPGPLPLDSVSTGILVLTVLGAAAGQGFLFLCGWFPGLVATPGTLLIAGAALLALLWLIGFYLFGTLLYPWLPRTNPLIYFTAAIAMGISLGGLFALAGVHRPARLE